MIVEELCHPLVVRRRQARGPDARHAGFSPTGQDRTKKCRFGANTDNAYDISSVSSAAGTAILAASVPLVCGAIGGVHEGQVDRFVSEGGNGSLRTSWRIASMSVTFARCLIARHAGPYPVLGKPCRDTGNGKVPEAAACSVEKGDFVPGAAAGGLSISAPIEQRSDAWIPVLKQAAADISERLVYTGKGR